MNFETSTPIYMQIAERLFYQLVRGEIKPGEKLPSVREMAIQASVNPNTIQRTYSEMERMGVVETKRGQGTFVVDHPDIVQQLKMRLQGNVIETFVGSMKDLGFTDSEMVVGLQQHLQRRQEK